MKSEAPWPEHRFVLCMFIVVISNWIRSVEWELSGSASVDKGLGNPGGNYT